MMSLYLVINAPYIVTNALHNDFIAQCLSQNGVQYSPTARYMATLSGDTTTMSLYNMTKSRYIAAIYIADESMYIAFMVLILEFKVPDLPFGRRFGGYKDRSFALYILRLWSRHGAGHSTLM